VTLPIQKLLFLGDEILLNLSYASSPSINPSKSEGGQDFLNYHILSVLSG